MNWLGGNRSVKWFTRNGIDQKSSSKKHHMNVIIGLGMLILGGVSAGSSYVPLKGVKGWAWESLWAVQGLVAWLLLPMLLALLCTPHL